MSELDKNVRKSVEVVGAPPGVPVVGQCRPRSMRDQCSRQKALQELCGRRPEPTASASLECEVKMERWKQA